MQIARFIIGSEKILLLAGCFFSEENNFPLPTPDLRYKSCAVEADMRIWKHVEAPRAQKIL